MLRSANIFVQDLLRKPAYRILRHILVLTAVVFITINVFWDEPVRFLPERFNVWVSYFLLFVVIIYLNMYLLVPRMLLKGRTWSYLLLVLFIMFSAIFAIGLMQDSAGGEPVTRPGVFEIIMRILSSIAGLALLIAGLTTLQLTKSRAQNAEKISKLETATMEIELANLQNQINPHFLFNMLNSANILADEDVEKSAFILKKLNDLLRYQIEGSSSRSVKLSEDIAFLDDYLQLEKVRRDRFCYTLQVQGDIDTLEVPPLLFIPFVENAVKHNPENDSYINIVFRIRNGSLYFECENPKPKSGKVIKKGGLGLSNIRKRLDLLFDNDYTLELKNNSEKYIAIMEFKL